MDGSPGDRIVRRPMRIDERSARRATTTTTSDATRRRRLITVAAPRLRVNNTIIFKHGFKTNDSSRLVFVAFSVNLTTRV